jgi:hypothetical protein
MKTPFWKRWFSRRLSKPFLAWQIELTPAAAPLPDVLREGTPARHDRTRPSTTSRGSPPISGTQSRGPGGDGENRCSIRD